MQRRNFLKGACRICLLGAAATTLVADLASCSPKVAGTNPGAAEPPFKPVVKNNQVAVPVSFFDSQAFQVISPAKYEYDIAIEKKADNSFTALLLKCTHYDNQLIETGNGYACSAHGSRFDKAGKVVKGPAATPLLQLKTQIINNQLLIQL